MPTEARSREALPQVHIINPFFDAAGGSEWRAISLHRELQPHANAQLWATEAPDPRLAAEHPIRQISRDSRPMEGVFVIVGVWFGAGEWMRGTRPSRIVLHYNTPAPQDLLATYRTLNAYGFFNIEVVFASKEMLDSVPGLDGVVEYSPIDIERFHPEAQRPDRAFTVGRVSRDVPYKHHPSDPVLYRDLVAKGCVAKLMGATCLSGELQGATGVTLLPALAVPADEFLRSLDCFYYRAAEHWHEAYGRVVAEAMACGLPVVAHREGGYRELIDHGRNGFLFETKDQALRLILRLKEDRKLRRAVSQAARESMEKLYGPEGRARTIEYYLRTR